jgi:hypothetical protein
MSNLFTTKIYSKNSSKVLPWKKKMITNGYNVSNGIQVKIDDINYVVITTNHSIPYNSKKIYSVSSGYLNKLILNKRSAISDLALLEYGTIRKDIKMFYNDTSELKYLTLNKFSKKIPKANSELKILLDDDIEFNFAFDKFGLQRINGSNDIPPTPVLSCFLSREMENYNLNGLSGSPVYFKNKIVGLVSNFDLEKKRINLTPSFLILKLLENFNNSRRCFNKNNNIEKINFIKIDAMPTKNGLVLNSDYSNKIRKGHIITRIDHKILDDNCCVYSQEIKHRIPWDTYIMTLFKDDKISVTFKDKTNFIAKLSVKDCNKYLKIDNNFKSDNIIIKGYVFCELNLPMIKYFFKHKLLLDGPSINKINCDNHSSSNSKEIVLIDYIGKEKDDVFKGSVTKKFNNKDFTIQNILTLKKYNNIKVKNLQHLYELIINHEKKKIDLHLEYNQKSILKLEL